MSVPVTVYGYLPAWGVPDISPYVTKVVNYLTFTGQKFDYKNQDLTRLDQDTPHGKLPMIDDNGKKIADSNSIIEYLKQTYGDKLDGDLTPEQAAQALAFNRMIEEHLYWSGIIEPRWRQDSGFETYVPYLVGGHDVQVGPELRKFLDDFRARIVAGFNGQGMGRRKTDVVLEFYKRDIDALANFLGSKKYFMGDKIHGIDASVYAILSHVVHQPQKWEGTGYAESKKNLVDYMARIKKEYNI